MSQWREGERWQGNKEQVVQGGQSEDVTGEKQRLVGQRHFLQLISNGFLCQFYFSD